MVARSKCHSDPRAGADHNELAWGREMNTKTGSRKGYEKEGMQNLEGRKREKRCTREEEK